QAEDGIRARTVTGVQTCALAISVASIATLKQAIAGIADPVARLKTVFTELDAAMQPRAALAALAAFRAQLQQLVSLRAVSLRQRSEDGRGGKGWGWQGRAGWA